MGTQGRTETLPAWQSWTPDAPGLRAAQRWRRGRRLWLTHDLGDDTRPDATAAAVLNGLTALDRHTFVVATTEPAALYRRAYDALLRPPAAAAGTLAPHLWPVVLAGPPPACPLDIATANDLSLVPAAPGARGLLLTAPVPVGELTRWLTLARAGRVFLEATVGAALPGWTGEARAACAALGVGLEPVSHTLVEPGGSGVVARRRGERR